MKDYLEALKYLWSIEFISGSFKEVVTDSKTFLKELFVWFNSIYIFLFRVFAFITAPVFLAISMPIMDFLNERKERALIKKKEGLVKSYTKNVASVNCRKEGWDD